MIESLANQKAAGCGKAMNGTWIEKSSPALTVMSLTPLRSMTGLLACSSTMTGPLCLPGSELPASLTAITRNVYSSPSDRLPTCGPVTLEHYIAFYVWWNFAMISNQGSKMYKYIYVFEPWDMSNQTYFDKKYFHEKNRTWALFLFMFVTLYYSI